jgi:hypothetical protein
MEQVKSVAEMADIKAAELTEQLGVKVHPLVFKDEATGQDIIGFIKEPSRQVKYAVLDKSMQGAFSAASEMLEAILIKEHSDPRIYSERAEDDQFNLGASMAAFQLVKLSANVAKKKS